MHDWERNWRGAGVFFAVLVVIGSIIAGSQQRVPRHAEPVRGPRA